MTVTWFRSIALSFFALAACGGISGVKRQRGSDGTPVFRGDNFPHTAGTAFWCYRLINVGGDETSSCRESKPSCAKQLSSDKHDGLTVLDGCTRHDEATCMTYYTHAGFRTDGETMCAATKADCALREEEYLETRNVPRDQLTPCTTIDKTFEPIRDPSPTSDR